MRVSKFVLSVRMVGWFDMIILFFEFIKFVPCEHVTQKICNFIKNEIKKFVQIQLSEILL